MPRDIYRKFRIARTDKVNVDTQCLRELAPNQFRGCVMAIPQEWWRQRRFPFRDRREKRDVLSRKIPRCREFTERLGVFEKYVFQSRHGEHALSCGEDEFLRVRRGGSIVIVEAGEFLPRVVEAASPERLAANFGGRWTDRRDVAAAVVVALGFGGGPAQFLGFPTGDAVKGFLAEVLVFADLPTGDKDGEYLNDKDGQGDPAGYKKLIFLCVLDLKGREGGVPLRRNKDGVDRRHGRNIESDKPHWRSGESVKSVRFTT